MEKLTKLGGTEAPKVRDPKVVKVAPNAPILQSKEKDPLILQSENPEEVKENFLIPYVLEGKKKTPTVSGMLGVITIAAILGIVVAYYDAKKKQECYSKTGIEGFKCRKKYKLLEIEQQIKLLRKRLYDCSKKIGREHEFLRQNCIDTTEDKIQELREKYRNIVAKKYKGAK